MQVRAVLASVLSTEAGRSGSIYEKVMLNERQVNRGIYTHEISSA